MTTSIHYSNRILPISILNKIPDDDKANWDEISLSINELGSIKNEIVENKKLGRLIRLINSRLDLKYLTSVQQKIEIINLLLTLYTEKKITIPMKISCLDILFQLMKKKGEEFRIKLNWKVLWKEALNIALRNNKSESVASESLMSNLLKNIIKFLHLIRRNFSKSDADEIVETALSKLKDLRAPKCAEAPIMLVICLPTEYSGYDSLVKEIMKIWPQIDHNPEWDSCWLTILCRARKSVSFNFDWKSINNFLYIKVREHFELPALKGLIPRSSAFPPYYSKLMLQQQFDSRSICVHKIAKLLYLDVLSGGSISHVLPNATTAPRLPEGNTVSFPGFNTGASITSGASELVLFLQSLRPYFCPSNNGAWSSRLAYFISTFVSEMARHVGKLLFRKINNSDASGQSPPNIFERGFHLPTLQFLSGTILVLTIEGLYGKNNIVLQFSSACIKNLLAVHPEMADIVFPLLLNALDDKAINCSHQAPAAFHALTVGFRQFMFPQPVILPYLPELLRLSINGIDSNDTMKTSITLNMYCHMLHWLPIKRNYEMYADRKENYQVSYLFSVANEKSPEKNILESLSKYSIAYTELGSAMEAWVNGFLDKIILLAENKEPPRQSSNNSNNSNTLSSIVNECLEVFFCALDDEMHEVATAKVLDFLKRSLPINASKEISNLLNSLVASKPTVLPRVLQVLIDDDLKENKSSAEKLAFRMYLMSGAIKRAGKEIITVFEQIRPFICKAWKHSETISEKTVSVRKASGKLLQSCLKGLCSFYPLKIKDAYGHVLGVPLNTETLEVNWYCPETDAVETGILALKLSLNEALNSLESFLQNDSTSLDDSDNIKKLEESIISYLVVISRGLKGAAEILGDEGGDDYDSSSNSNNSSAMETDLDETDETDRAAAPPVPVLETGRSAIQPASESSRNYLSTLRWTVLKFINLFNSKLDQAKEGTTLYSLSVSSGVRVRLNKIYNFIVLQRMAGLKNVDTVKKWYNVSKRINRSLIVKYMLSVSKKFSTTSSDHDHRTKNVTFWSCHDIAPYSLNDRARLAFAIRQKEFSKTMIKRLTSKGSKSSSQYMLGLTQLISLCGHEYDMIRSTSLGYLKTLVGRYGWRLDEIIKPLLLSISQVGTSYAAASGAYSVLSQSSVMKRIAGNWELTEIFLKSVDGSVAMMAKIEENDKREILLNRLSNTFSVYISLFHHQPLEPNSPHIESLVSIYNLYLKTDETNENSTTAGSSVSMRHTTISAFIILHLLGSNHLPLSSTLFKWGVSNVCESLGEPSQLIGLATIIKFVYIAATSQQIEPQGLKSIHQCIDKMNWRKFIYGVSRDHSRSENESSWSESIATILRSASYLSFVLPRGKFSTTSDSNIYSPYFKREHSGLFMCLALLNPDGLTGNFVTSVLQAANLVVVSNEEEAKDLNSTKAEIFAGFVRALYQPLNQQTINVQEVETVLCSYFAENVKSISLEYAKEWAEALCFGFSYTPINTSSSKIIGFVLQNLELSLSGNNTSYSGEVVEDGFNTQSKFLLMACSLQFSDICSCSIHLIDETAFGKALIEIFLKQEVDLVSPYRTSRDHISSLLALLVETTCQPSDLSKLYHKLTPPSILTSSQGQAQGLEATSTSSVDANQMMMSMVLESNKVKNKNCSLTVCDLVDQLFKVTAGFRTAKILPWLFSITLEGCAHPEIDVAKACHQMSILICQGFQVSNRNEANLEEDILNSFLLVLKTFSTHVSWHVRETVMMITSTLLTINWQMLSITDRKFCRDIFNEGMLDSKPEVQSLAKAGMTSYLVYKPIDELNSLATIYIKNCNAIAEREKRRKKSDPQNTGGGGGNGGDKPDKTTIITIMMAACMVLSFPYDLPSFTPLLLTTLTRHVASPLLKDTVIKAIQDFKRTHQDRWEEFKTNFTWEQLQDLQGAGAMSYYT